MSLAIWLLLGCSAGALVVMVLVLRSAERMRAENVEAEVDSEDG